MILEQKGWSVRVAASLLISREGDNQISCGAEALTPQANQRLEHRGVAVLHVDRAAAVEPAVLLSEFEWIERPVLGSSFDDIQVPDEEHRLRLPSTPQAHDDIGLGWMFRRRDQDHVGRRKACGEQSIADQYRRSGRAVGMRRIDLDQFLEDLARQLSIGTGRDGTCVAPSALLVKLIDRAVV